MEKTEEIEKINMKWINLKFPEDSSIAEKLQEIKEKTGITNNKSAVVHAILNYKDGK